MTGQTIRDKLAQELRRPITSEAQVVYLLIQVRKLMELDQDTSDWKALKFHCDWAAHARLTRAPAQYIVRQFDKWQELIEAMTHAADGERLAVDMSFFSDLNPTLNLSRFRCELREYLRLQGLDTSITDEDGEWTSFLHHYASVIGACPLRCDSQGLEYVDEVTLEVIDWKPNSASGSSPYQLVIEWRWTSKRTGTTSLNQQFF